MNELEFYNKLLRLIEGNITKLELYQWIQKAIAKATSHGFDKGVEMSIKVLKEFTEDYKIMKEN